MRPVEWGPAVLLLTGVLLVELASDPRAMALAAPLGDVLPPQFDGLSAYDVALAEEEQRVAGMSSYVYRIYREPESEAPALSLYVSYYESQTQGRTIHSPRNCLPGSGWEALASQQAIVQTAGGPVVVNRYLIQRGDTRALVLYWYQGRGRVAASEYAVKLDLLRDAALTGRSEEALVRVMVPVTDSEVASLALAVRLAEAVVPAVFRALPEVGT